METEEGEWGTRIWDGRSRIKNVRERKEWSENII